MRQRTLNVSRRGSALAVALAALMLVGAGCAKTAPQPSAPPAQQPPAPPRAEAPQPVPSPDQRQPGQPQPATQPPVALGGCSNPYYPLRNGYKIDYQTTASGTVTAYSMTVSDVTQASAKMTFDFPEKKLSMAQNLTCADGTVKTDSFLNLGSAGQMKTETKSVEGDLMPKDVAAGSQWSVKYEIATTVAGRQMTSEVSSDNKAVGEEQVTVPAGTFTALKIETTTTTSFSIPGVPAMKPNVNTETQWWVRGVGPVKFSATVQGNEVSTVATKVTQP